MSEFDQPPVQAVVPAVAQAVSEQLPALPSVQAPFPAGVATPEAVMAAHGHMADGPNVLDGGARASASPDGVYAGAEATAHAEPGGVILDGGAGVNTDRGAYADANAQAGPLNVHATTDDGGSVRATAHADDDHYTIDASGGANQLGTNPTGDFHVDVRANPVPGMNVGLSGGGTQLGQPDAAGNMQAYAAIPLGDHANLTAKGGMAVDQNGVTYNAGAGIDAEVAEHLRINAGVQVSDADGDGRPDVAGQAGVTIR